MCKTVPNHKSQATSRKEQKPHHLPQHPIVDRNSTLMYLRSRIRRGKVGKKICNLLAFQGIKELLFLAVKLCYKKSSNRKMESFPIIFGFKKFLCVLCETVKL